MIRLSLILMLVACMFMSVGIVMAQDEEAADTPSADAADTQGAEVVEGGATIRGEVVDTTTDQNPIEGVAVKIVNTSTGQEDIVETNSDGIYEKTGLPAGRYTMSYAKEGYGPRVGKSKVVAAGGEISERIKMREKDTIVSFFKKFGFVFYPLAICSIVALTFIIERLFTFVRSRSRIGTEQFIASIADSLRKENIMEAVSTCEEAGGPLANVLKAGLLRYSQAQIEERDITKEEIQEAIEEASLLEIPELERNLPVLGTVAVVSPLFGLLGTVTGMITAFTTIALEGTGDPQQLAGGISQALLTTAGGLTIAIPCLIFFQLFDSWVNRHMVEISQVSTEIVNQLIVGEANA
ncbi:MAG: MotA/TolQ/ExbB proton channel family protein [Candidatus Poribacteria bacterium]|nr:MotA/TolQ/ExbB proton channel family protein [Candidatus Poribacteria bacterium]